MCASAGRPSAKGGAQSASSGVLGGWPRRLHEQCYRRGWAGSGRGTGTHQDGLDPTSGQPHHRGVKGWPVKCHVLGAAAPRPPRKRHSVRPGTGPLCHPGAGQEQVRTRTEGSGLGVTSAIGRGLAAPAPPRSGQWVGRAQHTGGSVAVPSVRRQCVGAPHVIERDPGENRAPCIVRVVFSAHGHATGGSGRAWWGRRT